MRDQNIFCDHEVYIKQDFIVKERILGIPNLWVNDTDRFLIMKRILDLDRDGNLWMTDDFASTDIVFNIRSDFNVHYHVFIYY